MKKQKRWLAGLLSIVMLFGLVPQSVFATTEQDLQYTIKEIPSEDKTSTTVEMEIEETQGNTLTEIILPDDSSVFSHDTDGVAGFKQDGKNIVRFTVTENGTVSFELKYDSEREVKSDLETTQPPASTPSDADQTPQESEEVEDSSAPDMEETEDSVTEPKDEVRSFSLSQEAEDITRNASASDAELDDSSNSTDGEIIIEQKSMTVTHEVTSFASLHTSTPELKTLTIRYYIQGETTMIAEPYIATQSVGTSYSVPSPVIEKFELADNSQATVDGTLDDNTEVSVYYTYTQKTANYTMKYMLQNPVTMVYEENSTATVTGSAPIGDIIDVDDKIFTGYERQASELFLEITGDNPTKELYYDSIDQPYIIFQTGGSYVEPISAMAGTDISNDAGAVPTPTRQGYTFDGWDTAIPATMPTEDVVIKATWTPATSNYMVIHWLQNADDDNYVMSGDIETRTGTTEALAVDFDTKTYDNFNYSYKDENVEITADGHAVLNVYYNRRILTFTFLNKDGSEWCSFSGRYNQLIPDDFPTYDECKTYYVNQYPEEITAGKKFVGTKANDAGTTTFYIPTRFSFISRHMTQDEVQLVPYFFTQGHLFEANIWGESLDDTGESFDGTLYKVIDTKNSVAPSDSVITYIGIPIGYDNGSARFRTASTKAELSGKAFDILNYVDGGAQVYAGCSYFSDWKFDRIRSHIFYSSNSEDIKKTFFVPYEKSVDLSIIPTNGGTDEHFVGWYTSPQLFSTQPLAAYQMPPNKLTLHAKWVRNDHTLTFDSNGGNDVDPITVMGGTNATAPAEPTKAGFAFTGWHRADGTRWSFDMTVEEDATLYAHWKRANTVNYTVEHYNLDAGTMLKQETLNAYVGDTMVARALTAQDAEYPADTYLVPDFASKSLLVSGDATQNVIRFEYKDPTIKDYTVHYYEQGTTNELKTSKTVTGTKNTVVTEFSETIADYTVDAEVKQATLIYGVANTIIFYYVQGTTPPQTRYSVTYSPNDAFASGSVVDTSSPYAAGTTVTVLANTFTNSSKEFAGWNTQADGNGTSYAANGTFAMPANDVVLYAQWRTAGGGGSDPTYTVTYNANGGTGTLVDPRSPYTAGTTVTVLANTFTNGSKTFTGWNTQANGNGTSYAANGTFAMPANDVILYAQWKNSSGGGGGGGNPTYTVTYNANGGTGTLVDPRSPYTVGTTVTVLANTFTNGSKTFTGWNTQADGNGTSYAANNTFVMPAHNIVLYAQWQTIGGGSGGSGSGGDNPTPPAPIPPNPTSPETTPPIIPAPGGKLDDIPKTSDSSNTSLWLLLMGLSLVGFLGTVSIGRKKRYFHKK